MLNAENSKMEANPPIQAKTRSSKLQTRITVIVIAALIPIIGVWVWGAVTRESQRLEELLLQKAQATSINGAAVIGQVFEDAIASGELTKAQVFDTNYIQYSIFNPALFPTFSGDPTTLNKYHTAYDAYTDQHIQKIIDSFLFDKDVIYAVPVDKNGYLPTHNTPFSTGNGNPATDRTKQIFNDAVGIKAAQNLQQTLQQVYPRPNTNQILWDVSSPIYVNGEHWGAFRVGIELAQNQQRIIQATQEYLIAGLILLLIISIFAWALGRYLSAPIIRLTDAAKQFASGQIDRQVNIQSRDEIGTLAEAFNTMTGRLRTIISNLEGRTNELALSNKRATEQTAQLRLVAEVIRATTSIREPDLLFTTVTELVSREFDIYHVGIFLMDDSRAFAILRAANSQGGAKMLKRGYRLPADEKSIVGYATTTSQPRIASNAGTDAVLFNNADLPETRSEAAIPLKFASEIIGVMDLQSIHPQAFNKETVEVLSILADQISVAIQNVRLFEQSRETLKETELAYAQQTGQAWKQFSSLQTTRGYHYDGMESIPLTGPATSKPDGALSIRVQLRGQTIGTLSLKSLDPNRAWTDDEIVLAEAAAERAALSLESARLLDESQRRASKERVIGEISTKIGSMANIDSIIETAVRELVHTMPGAEIAIQFQSKESEGK